MSPSSSRLYVIDALRGLAVCSIFLIHNIEYFGAIHMGYPLPAWLVVLDKIIWDTLFFLFGGKSYVIFALLFGLTFFIQSDNQNKLGYDFRKKFAWRLVVLILFGIFNSILYPGDILITFGVLGFLLIPFSRLSDNVIVWIVLILLLQPYEWIEFLISLKNSETLHSADTLRIYLKKVREHIHSNSLTEVWYGNLTNGNIVSLLRAWEKGRIFQIFAAFLLGILAGRKALFHSTPQNTKFWKNCLLYAFVFFIPLFITKTALEGSIKNNFHPLVVIFTCWSATAFALAMVSGFVLLYQQTFFYKILNIFSPLGKMSLTCYISQSVIGSFIYYEIGLGWYKYTSTTSCLLIGIVLIITQGYLCSLWLKYNCQGPLEKLWHKATWIGVK